MWWGYALIVMALLLLPFSSVNAQVPFGGFITLTYTGMCTASAPTAIPFILAGVPSGPFMYIPGAGITYPYGPPTHPGQAILGFAVGFYPCLFWSYCGLSLCPIPFPAFPGGMLVVMSGTSI